MPDPSWLDDPLELAVREFCFGGGRAIPPSVFLGRVVGPGEPLWLPEDTAAALEWQAYQRSLCPGCNRPRDESFDIGMDDRYEVIELRCHACFARDLRAYNRAASRDRDQPPPLGEYYIVKPEEPEQAEAS